MISICFYSSDYSFKIIQCSKNDLFPQFINFYFIKKKKSKKCEAQDSNPVFGRGRTSLLITTASLYMYYIIYYSKICIHYLIDSAQMQIESLDDGCSEKVLFNQFLDTWKQHNESMGSMHRQSRIEVFKGDYCMFLLSAKESEHREAVFVDDERN